MRAELGKRACVSMVLSGTASGVMGAAWVAREAGHPNVITLDIGGTSADVALIIDGQPQFGLGEKIGDLPLYIPSVAVSSIGDGGGSIAWVDGFGVLKVGPESAGSAPGPACYGRGGTLPTITDAFAVCGFLGQHDLAYGAFRPTSALARAAIGTLAEPHRSRARADRGGDHPHRHLRHVRRGEQARRPLRRRHARLRPPAVRRRRPDAGLLPGARARHAARR